MSNDESRLVLGRQVRNQRYSQDISIETAAQRGGIGHMTWRKIERGQEVQDRSYAGVDRAFGWTIGHSLACLRNNQSLEIPTPTGARGASLDPTALSTDAEPERDPAADPHAIILTQLERLSLVQINALQDTIQFLVAERRKIMDDVDETIDETMDKAKGFQFEFNGRYLFETSRDVGDEYERAFGYYMDARTDLSNFHLEIGDLKEAPVPSLAQFNELLRRTRQKSQDVEDAIDQLRSAEESAIRDLHLKDQSKSMEGRQDNGMDA